ncbi:hypothetical protein NXY56_005358 [Leishmania guyanensis]|uniref:Uncharacterized protein n=1 Tax=Leishmania guyanensis TaxID=5670 RepID=A0A1E1J2Q0_LEIGU|nr:hypothetical protein, unknown function [Leishmania guyanensis]
MLVRNVPLYAVKVVSASLIESMVFSGTGRPTANSHATLTFHLHRVRDSESFGVDYAFRPFGGVRAQCFVRGMPADLVASSAALRGVLGNGQASYQNSIRVTSINGVVRLTKKTVRGLLDSGRDAVVQCAVSAVAGGASDPQQVAAGVKGEGNEGNAIHPPKGRDRRLKVRVKDAHHADDTEVAEESPKSLVKRRGRHAPASSLKIPKVSKKRLRYSGERSVVEGLTNKDVDLSSIDGSALANVGVLNPAVPSAADDVNAAALMTLNELSPMKPVRTRGRRSTRLSAFLGAKRQSTTSEKTSDDVWFMHAEAAPTEGGEGEEASAVYAAIPTRKRRGRSPKVAAVDAHAEVEAVEALKREQRRSTARLFELEKQNKVTKRRGRPRKTNKSIEELGTTQIAEARSRGELAKHDADAYVELEF